MTNENGMTETTEATETPEVQETETQEVEVPFEVPEGFRLLSDDELEQLADEVAKSHKEGWEVQELVDNAVAAGEMNELMRNELLWEFQQNGRMLRGLTAAMIAHLAKVEGISEEIDYRVYDGEGDYHEFEVVVSIADDRHPDGKSFRSGFSEEPKMVNGRYDKFGKIKAYTKAFTRACKKLLPQDLMMAAVFKLARLVPADWQPRQALPQQRQPRALPPAQTNGNGAAQETATDKAMKACFAAFGDKEADLAKKGVSKDAFWTTLKEVLGVQSRTDMTEKQWKDVRAALNRKGYGKIVNDVIAKVNPPNSDADATDAETEKGASPSETTDGDIPF